MDADAGTDGRLYAVGCETEIQRGVDEAVKIAKETAERIQDVLSSDTSIEAKQTFALCEIAILLAGLLDTKLAELGVEDE
jgi:hypothetical protein